MTITIEHIITTLQRDGDGVGTEEIARRLGVERIAVRKPVNNAKSRDLIKAEKADDGVIYWLTTAGRTWKPITPSERASKAGTANARKNGKRKADKPAPAVAANTKQVGDMNVADLAQTPAAPADAAICADCAGVQGLVADIRKAAGDPQGKLMQDELVARIAGQYRDAGRMHDAVADLAAANAKLEGVAHALRGCGLPALREVTASEDLQQHVAALTGAYQMAMAGSSGAGRVNSAIERASELLANAIESASIDTSDMDLEELAAFAADQLRNARAMVAKLEHLLQSARNEADHLRAAAHPDGAPAPLNMRQQIEAVRCYLENDQQITLSGHCDDIIVRSTVINSYPFTAKPHTLHELLDALATACKFADVPF